MSEIKFKKIKNKTIFTTNYEKFTKNNTIVFSKQDIAIIYGPNGTGKTSLIKAMSGEKDTAIEYVYNDKNFLDGSQFYIINDQNSRNIIQGDVKDFLMGDRIKEEFELKSQVQNEYNSVCDKNIKTLKDEFSITSSSSNIIDCVSNNPGIQKIVKDLANKQSKGSRIKIEDYICEIEKNLNISISDHDDSKADFIIDDLSKKDSVILELENLNINDLAKDAHVKEIEENEEALRVLDKFKNKNQCIVCDTDGINSALLIKEKTENRDKIIKRLDEKTRKIIEKINNSLQNVDPFNIKEIILSAIESDNKKIISDLIIELKKYKEIIGKRIIDNLVRIYNTSTIKDINDRYTKLINEKVEVSEEDVLFIDKIISNSMNKNFKIDRDINNNIKISLDDNEFMGRDRSELPLSTGEQNFLSLTFEFLKAKNSSRPIIVLDDPISSFDSIYKNKIAYAIIKMLNRKKRIILTHNMDLIRLLNGQCKGCFNLFIFNNTSGEENGFIQLSSIESKMIISIVEILDFLRNKENRLRYIKDEYLFQISMIPFMRGYSMMIDDKKSILDLTELMHGYKDKIINLSEIYKRLFNYSFKKEAMISVDDILKIELNKIEIIDKKQYPLFNRTLIHTLTYLFLRLIVEKTLVDKYKIDVGESSSVKQLGQIISKAFPESEKEKTEKRVFLTTKKTLLNEFNHFEGNMSIFQPAIDITDSMLIKERDEIMDFIKKIKKE